MPFLFSMPSPLFYRVRRGIDAPPFITPRPTCCRLLGQLCHRFTVSHGLVEGSTGQNPFHFSPPPTARSDAEPWCNGVLISIVVLGWIFGGESRAPRWTVSVLATECHWATQILAFVIHSVFRTCLLALAFMAVGEGLCLLVVGEQNS